MMVLMAVTGMSPFFILMIRIVDCTALMCRDVFRVILNSATMGNFSVTGCFLDSHFYQLTDRFIDEFFISTLFLLHSRRGTSAPVPLPTHGDKASLSTKPETNTITKNPGPERIIDKYVY